MRERDRKALKTRRKNQKPCEVCGKLLMKPHYINARFCKVCRKKRRDEQRKKIKTCKICGKQLRKPYYIKTAEYCKKHQNCGVVYDFSTYPFRKIRKVPGTKAEQYDKLELCIRCGKYKERPEYSLCNKCNPRRHPK